MTRPLDKLGLFSPGEDTPGGGGVPASIEVAVLFRAAGPGYRAAKAGRLNLTQLKAMSATETCRTAALGGQVEACEYCGHRRIAYNNCRNRHCPKFQGAVARSWLAAREVDLLPVRVLGKLFRRLFLARLIALHDAGAKEAKRWIVYAKPTFAGPEAVLAYLSRFTHRIAISNRRLIGFDAAGASFQYKDYRRDGADRQQVVQLAADVFIRRFLLLLLPRGCHRIRHYGLLAGGARKASLAPARRLLEVAPPPDDDGPGEPPDIRPPCPCCGSRMVVIESFERWCPPRAPPTTRAPHRETAP